MKRRIGEFRHLGNLGVPGRREGLPVCFDPMGLPHHPHRDIVRLRRPDQPDAALDLAIVEHDAGSRDLNGSAPRPLIDEQLGARIVEFGQSGVKRHRTVAPALVDRQQTGFRTGARMGVDRLAIDDDEAFGAQRLQPGVIGARHDRALDAGGQELFEGREEDALKLDGEREQPVEERRDRRQLVLDAVRVHQLQAGGGLETVERATLDLAAHQQHIELAEGVAGVVALQIVLGAEQPLAAGLTLATRDRAQRVEAARDRA